VFSAMLNIDSRIARILLFSGNHFEFYSCEFLKIEIAKHKNKILSITKYSQNDFLEIEYLVTKNIHFINHMLIDPSIISNAEKTLAQVDIDDTPFLALSKYLKADLWTGDKKLINALIKHGYKNVCTTEQLLLKI